MSKDFLLARHIRGERGSENWCGVGCRRRFGWSVGQMRLNAGGGGTERDRGGMVKNAWGERRQNTGWRWHGV